MYHFILTDLLCIRVRLSRVDAWIRMVLAVSVREKRERHREKSRTTKLKTAEKYACLVDPVLRFNCGDKTRDNIGFAVTIQRVT